MTAKSNAKGETYRRVNTILISQPKPERSPLYELEKQYGLKIDWRPFIHVEPVSVKEFRKQRIRPNDFGGIIFTSKYAIEHFFRLCKEMRIEMPQETRYFCLTEAVSNYLQKFIVYRKRKVAVGNRDIEDIKLALMKYRRKLRFLLPCSNLGAKRVSQFLDENDFDWQEAEMYRTVSSDLSDLKDITYDMLVFYSPLGIKSLYDNFPDFKQNNTRIAVWGDATSKAVEERGLKINVKAPQPGIPSMTEALKRYLDISNQSK